MVDRHTLSYNSKMIYDFLLNEYPRLRSLSVTFDPEYCIDYVPKLK
jgi:hypothetical protein